MMGLGMGELIVILVIAMVIFGAGKLPEIGTSLGKSIANFKKAADAEPPSRIDANQEVAAVTDGETVVAETSAETVPGQQDAPRPPAGGTPTAG